jgi:diadenosine tetraphosphate (Ap4A) HIT family hydrolase
VATIFTRIIEGDIPGTFVWRDEHCVAFMSINPMAHGHTLVVPIAEIDHWVDAPLDLAAHLFTVTHRIAQAQRDVFAPERVGVIIAGYEVPHTHIHVIPTDDMGQLSFANARSHVDRDELESAAGALRSALGTDQHGHRKPGSG